MLLSLGGVCIDMMSRCDNINDCADKSDEADCSRVRKTLKVFAYLNIFFKVSIDSTYQKFIVPPPLSPLDKSAINVSLELSQIMDIRYRIQISSALQVSTVQSLNYLLLTQINSSEVGGYFQVQFVLTLKWFETRLQFKNLKDDFSLNNFLPSEVEKVWVPELTFSNTEEKPTTILDERASISVQKIGIVAKNLF